MTAGGYVGELRVGRRQGLDNKIILLALIALIFVVAVRPRQLSGFLEFGPIVFALFLLAIHLAGRTATGLQSVYMPLPVMATVGWFVMTAAWSGSRVQSIADAGLIICIASLASLVASFCTLRDLVGGVMIGALAMLAASAAVAIVAPASGLTPWTYHAGSLRGLMSDRNSLSFVLILGLIAALVFEFRGRTARVRRIAVAGLLFGGVLWTESSTCLILSAVAFALYAVLRLLSKSPPNRRRWGLAIATTVFAGIAVYVIAHIDELFELVDRDSTLTGRTKIWPAVENLIAVHPWTGYGWGGVWGSTNLNQQVNVAAGFDVPHAHNGFLDVQIQVGTVGLALLVVVIGLVMFRGVANYLSSESSCAAWPIIMVIALVIYNRAETSLSRPVTLFLLFATLVVLEKGNRTSATDRRVDVHPSLTPRSARDDVAAIATDTPRLHTKQPEQRLR